MLFSEFDLSASIQKAIETKGYTQATPIQQQAIPVVLAGRDILAAAQTGTGKTAGFTLPILQNLMASKKAVSANNVRVLVLTPTRELAAQVHQSVKDYGQFLNVTSNVVFGGVKINPQMMALRRGTDVLIATPGRLLDLANQNAVKFSELEVLVLDEADRMLDMGFIRDIQKIIRMLPVKRQNLMFSATFSAEIRELAKSIVRDPVEVSATPENKTANTVKQWVVPVDKGRKPALLSKIILDNNWNQVLVFSKTKHGANKLVKKLLADGIDSAAIHGNKSQSARTKALADFKTEQIRVLVATDIAARGLDIVDLPHVINYDLPNVPADYVHRIGRTGRAGATGEAISFVCLEDVELLRDVQNLTGQILERKPLLGFEPSQALPELAINSKAKKIKKPKQTSGDNRGDSSNRDRGNSSKPNARPSRRPRRAPRKEATSQ